MENRPAGEGHHLTLNNRERLQLEGVKNVGSFEPSEVILETELGVLVIKGENLHMQHLNLDQGKVALQGRVHSLNYAEENLAERNKGLLGRLFR
ncbi:MAG TPA: sporulation protein YabP [Firmicutes bacterium]|mgnify:FL=1|nr:sporulation protein YabP [Bacillota bacterium]HOQ24355.1 sporulation protein YabP [Bacillota bacterium]HPT67676.1 sporulation protein YabP [Bacillota bacterium]